MPADAARVILDQTETRDKDMLGIEWAGAGSQCRHRHIERSRWLLKICTIFFLLKSLHHGVANAHTRTQAEDWHCPWIDDDGSPE